MGALCKRIIVAALSLLLVSAPGASMGREDRGATLVVTLKDGQRVKGELLAVKPDSLLILKKASGEGATVDIADISTVRIVRKSRTLLGGVVGLLAGGGAGALWGLSAHGADRETPGFNALLGIIVIGAPATVLGLVIGTAVGLDPVMVFEGRPAEEVQRSLSKLGRMARESSGYSLPPSLAPEPDKVFERARDATISPPPQAPVRRHRASRFRLTWAPGFNMKSRSATFPPGGVSFRFLDTAPPADGDSRSSSVNAYSERPRILLGRMSLAYEWNPRWSAEMEIFLSGKYQIRRYFNLESRSAMDGRTYTAYGGTREEMDPVSLLFGLTFRPFPPAVDKPHVLELGVAGGLAWPRAAPKTFPFENQRAQVTEGSKATWTARVRASYDHYFVPAFGIGAFAEYRWLEARSPGFIWTDILELRGEDKRFPRLTELTVAGRRLALDDFALGLRFVVRL